VMPSRKRFRPRRRKQRFRPAGARPPVHRRSSENQ